MSTNMSLDGKVNSITESLKLLHSLLAIAEGMTLDALNYLENGDCNGAIEAVSELDDTLADANAFYRVAAALHRLREL